MVKPIVRPRVAAKTGHRPAVQVTTALSRQKQVLDEQSREEQLPEVQVAAPVAYVEVGFGKTINTGDFNSLRIDVRVTMPCAPEDVETTYVEVSDTVNAFLTREENAWMKG